MCEQLKIIIIHMYVHPNVIPMTMATNTKDRHTLQRTEDLAVVEVMDS